MKHKSEEMKKAYNAGGFRERYAMKYGKKTIVTISGHKCYKFTYSTRNKYQDANGATFDTVRGCWIS